MILIGCTVLALLSLIIYMGLRLMKASELRLTDIKRLTYPISANCAIVGYSFTFIDGSGHSFYTTLNDSNQCTSSTNIVIDYSNRLLDASTNININSSTNSNNGNNANTNININTNTNSQTTNNNTTNNTTNNNGDTIINNQTCQNGVNLDSNSVTVCVQQGKGASCFPSNTVLITLKGPKSIADIQIGDYVLTSRL
jgi:hypothetical protein